MKKRLLRALPVVVAAAALAVASRDPRAPLVIIALVLGSVSSSRRLPLDRATQRLAMIVIVMLTFAGLRASGIPMHGPRLGAFGYGAALAPLAMTGLRLWIGEAEGGSRVDVSLCFVSLLATAGGKQGFPYLAFVAAFLSAAIALQRSEHTGRASWAEISPRTHRIAGALLVLATVCGIAAAVAARTAYEQVHRRFRRSLEAGFQESAEWSDSVRLGKLTTVLKSDAIVLRVSGPEVDRLRGVVLDEYGGGRWTKAKAEILESIDVPRTRPAGADVVEVRHIHADQDNIFLPLSARDVAAPQGAIRKDSMGVVHAAHGDIAREVWFRLGERDSLKVVGARVDDLLMPRKLRAPLTAIAAEWTRGAGTPEEALAAIQSHLRRDYTYSLEDRPSASLDPILEFLTVSHRGHCEYFASALALLARTVGIPTRMILGYRVGERNPYFSHYVVRSKNAHAWVEAYLPNGSWITVDPTPMTELPQDLAHDEMGFAAAFEAMAVGWEYVEAWLVKRTVFELAVAALLGVIVFSLQRWLRTRARAVSGGDDGLEFDPPPEAYSRLESEMGRRGLGRERGESIERWSARIGDSELAKTLAWYVAARYGREESQGLAIALSDAAREIGRHPLR